MTAIFKNISNLKSQISNRQTGFTLIELLVVIGILGILASALIATIDPFEQLKKAQDANTKNAAVEFANASIRYYTTHQSLPWEENGVSNCGSSGVLSAASMTGCIDALLSDNELKAGFKNATGILGSILINGSTNSVTACFQPVSRSQQKDPNTIYGSNGAPTAGCAGATSGGLTTCYWCSE